MLELRILNSRSDAERVSEFQSNLHECYASYAVQHAAQKARIPVQEGPDSLSVQYVAVLGRDGAVLGGTRIHVRSPGNPLPMEQAMPHEARLKHGLDLRQPLGVVEYAGLWALPAYRGTGLSRLVSCLAVAATPLLGARVGCGFTHHHLTFWTPLGFSMDDQLGFFAYPDERYSSYVLWVDPVNLESAEPEYRQTVFKMREALRRGRSIFWEPSSDSLHTQIRYRKPKIRQPFVSVPVG